MKRFLIIMSLVLSFFVVDNVEAQTYTFTYSGDSAFTYPDLTGNSYYTNIDTFIKDADIDISEFEYILNNLYDDIISYYGNYKEDSPYYYIAIILNRDNNPLDYTISLILASFVEEPTISNYTSSSAKYFSNSYRFSNATFTLSSEVSTIGRLSLFYPAYEQQINNPDFFYQYSPLSFAFANFNLLFDLQDTTFVVNDYNPPLIFEYDDIIQPIFGDDIKDAIINPNYTEINLNDYAYVALSLKNYNQEPFSTNVHVKGNYCLTPVYNYGMTERKDILTGSQVDRCTPYYDNYTPVRTYIIESDLKNYSIYYLKAYDTSKDNYVKVDTSVFNVTLITEEESNNPYVTIDGKLYPTIPYNDLTDTSTKSEDEGYVAGAVEEFKITDIFTEPLEVFKSITESFTGFAKLITSLFSFLPPEFLIFLQFAFFLAIVIGIIKIIL